MALGWTQCGHSDPLRVNFLGSNGLLGALRDVHQYFPMD